MSMESNTKSQQQQQQRYARVYIITLQNESAHSSSFFCARKIFHLQFGSLFISTLYDYILKNVLLLARHTVDALFQFLNCHKMYIILDDILFVWMSFSSEYGIVCVGYNFVRNIKWVGQHDLRQTCVLRSSPLSIPFSISVPFLPFLSKSLHSFCIKIKFPHSLCLSLSTWVVSPQMFNMHFQRSEFG